MFIRRIHIRNFQSYADGEFKLHPCLNVIVGATDVGKSAFLRALRKVWRDLPSGTSFIHTGARGYVLKLVTDQHTVVRKVGSRSGVRVNEYIVDGECFASFGRDIPVEVCKALASELLDIGDSHDIDLNYAGQLEPPFLLLDPPSVRAKVLGVLTGSVIVDKAGMLSNRARRDALAQVQSSNSAASQLDAELAAFPALDDVEQLLLEVKVSLDVAHESQERYQHLQQLQASYEQATEQRKQAQERLRKLESVSAVDLSQAAKLLDRLQVLSSLRQDWSDAEAKVHHVQRASSKAKDNLVQTEKELKVFKKKLSICPLCDQPLKG